jgi:hypothetical protein
MIRRFVLTVGLVVVAGIVVRSIPDLVRYLKIREM